MFTEDRKLYLANVWPEIITKRGLSEFDKRGWRVGGNWLDGTFPEEHQVILSAPARFDGAVVPMQNQYPDSRVFPHLIFPDELVGWDVQQRHYQFSKDPFFEELFNTSSLPNLSHSRFTAGLVTQTYPGIGEVVTTYLPIDILSIQEAEREQSPSVRVLWNHMWRSDKGVVEAFEIIESLAGEYPAVEFWIGREGRWGDNPDVASVKEEVEPRLGKLRDKGNIYFQPTFESQETYWRFLRSFDIGFSTSYHEGFGLSMLEQAASGIACVVPNAESYPEVLPSAVLTDRGSIKGRLGDLIDNSAIRNYVSQGCLDDAQRFEVTSWVEKLTKLIDI